MPNDYISLTREVSPGAGTKLAATPASDDRMVLNVMPVTGVGAIAPSWVLESVGRKITVAYPDAVTEVYQYIEVSTLVYELTVVYSNATKSVLVSAERTA